MVSSEQSKKVSGLRFKFNVEVGKKIDVSKALKKQKRGGDGENGRRLAS